MYNTGTTSWDDLQGQTGALSTLTTVTASSLTGGITYRFRVRAHNDYGFGSYSAEATYTAAAAPDTPSAVTTSTISTSVKIQWAAPSSNFASITKYQIVIAD